MCSLQHCTATSTQEEKSFDILKAVFQPQLSSLCATSSRGGNTPLSQQELIHWQETEAPELHFHLQPQATPPTSSAPPAARSAEDGSRSSTDSPSVGSSGDPGKAANILFHHVLILNVSQCCFIFPFCLVCVEY